MNITHHLKVLILLSVFIPLVLLSSAYGYVAKIDNYTISLQELQKFVDVQKFLAKEKNLEEFMANKQVKKSDLLSDYIDMMLLYLTADKNKYSFATQNKNVQNVYSQTRSEQLKTLFINRQLDIAENPPTTAELKKEFEKVKSRTSKTFKELSDQEKRNLYQISILRKIQDKKKSYRLQLEKRYDVKRTPKNKTSIGSVNNKKISRKDIDKLLDKEVSKLGISLTALKKDEPEKFREIRKDAVNELIFQEMITLEMKKQKFASKQVVKDALQFYQYQIAIEEYVKNELADNIRISDNELDEAFVEVSQTRPDIQKLLPTQQEKLLKSFIIQKKLPILMEELLNERKEESIIKRNKSELNKLT
ncbi:hypothetical protein COTS27_01300 [Spirochaetota bacterium]|nr:hypothetical protein COTS27_01300 [Spirochaetota bacterium]